MTQRHCNAKSKKIIQIDEEQVKDHLGEIVRGTVQETLNALLDEEAARLCRAKRYERTEERKDTRAGYYMRKLHTKAGEVDIRMPKLRALPFETAIIERYRRRVLSRRSVGGNVPGRGIGEKSRRYNRSLMGQQSESGDHLESEFQDIQNN